MACVCRGVQALVVSTEGLLPYQLGYRSATDRESSLHYCSVPQLRAQLFTVTYHHLQLCLLSFFLSQAAPGMSQASLCISYGIVRVPVLPTGTRGSLPSMEDTGITYKTCSDSRRSYTMVWLARIHPVHSAAHHRLKARSL